MAQCGDAARAAPGVHALVRLSPPLSALPLSFLVAIIFRNASVKVSCLLIDEQVEVVSH